MQRRTLALAILTTLSLSAINAPAAQSEGMLLTKPLKLVVGFPPGGSADTLARALAQELQSIAPAVIVDNKPGAGGRLALEAVKKSDSDGTTLVLTPASMMVLYPYIYKKLPYSPVNDFEPVTKVAAAAYVFVVGPAVPNSVTSLKDFAQWAKSNPKDATYGSSGAGSMLHFTGVSLGKSMKIDLLHVPYKGSAPAMTDLMGGQIAANVSVMSNALPQVKANKIRALAVSSPKRIGSLPQTPTMAELGFGEATATEWFGVFAPAKTPTALVAALNKAINKAAESKAFQETVAKYAFEAVPGETAESFKSEIKADIDHWGPVVKASGFTSAD